MLTDAGIAAEPFVTEDVGSATILAHEAIARGCDTIIACGGDGHCARGPAGDGRSDVALGVIPLGTRQRVSCELGLSGSPARGRAQTSGRRSGAGIAGTKLLPRQGGNSDSRYFTVAAGVGADALLMSRLDSRLKRRLGYVLYLIEATRIWATHSFPLFEVVLPANGGSAGRVVEVSQLLVVRVRSFGGVLRHLAPGASLQNGNLSLLAFKTQSRFRYMLFLLAVIVESTYMSAKSNWWKPHQWSAALRMAATSRCLSKPMAEVLGLLPVRIEAVPHGLNLLIPRGAQP